MTNLQQKTVLITGASAGIGAACAKQFAQQGARLILSARRLEKLHALQAELGDTEVYLLPLDIRNASAVKTAIGSLPNNWQAIDILINNAGLACGLDPIAQADTDDWEQMIDTNVNGLLYVTRYILPNMQQRQAGHIVNIGSVAGHGVYAGGTVYCATKHAVRALSKGLKIECHGSPIRVSEIDPGAVATDFSLVRFKQDEKRADSVYQGFTPLIADDIAAAVIYVTSAPAHVNVSELVITPTAQSPDFSIAREVR